MSSLRIRFPCVSRIVIGGLALVAFLGLASPGLVYAQAIAPKDIIGSWTKKGERTIYLTFTDSTYILPMLTARWHLAGDTLVTDSLLRNTTNFTAANLRRVVVLRGNELTLTNPSRRTSRVYVRADSVQVKSAKP